MPYISGYNRKLVEKKLNKGHVELTCGELNYAITKLFHEWLKDRGGVNYDNINTLIGTLECAKLELYRMVAAPYENKKRMENGSVSDLDAKSLEDVR